VTFAYRPVGTRDWTQLGTDDNAPFRVFHDVRDLPKGTLLEYRAVVKDHSGNRAAAGTYAITGTPPVVEEVVPEPKSVSVAGTLNDEMSPSCAEWQPSCPAAELTEGRDERQLDRHVHAARRHVRLQDRVRRRLDGELRGRRRAQRRQHPPHDAGRPGDLHLRPEDHLVTTTEGLSMHLGGAVALRRPSWCVDTATTQEQMTTWTTTALPSTRCCQRSGRGCGPCASSGERPWRTCPASPASR
jgi:hypothetical protein